MWLLCGTERTSQGHTQDLTKGGTHVHAQIIDGCGLLYCTPSQRQTANTSRKMCIQLDYRLDSG